VLNNYNAHTSVIIFATCTGTFPGKSLGFEEAGFSGKVAGHKLVKRNSSLSIALQSLSNSE